MSQIQGFGTGGGGGGSGIMTINGDSGSVTGSTVKFDAVSQAGSSVSFSGSSTTMSLNVTDANSNTIIGNGCGNSSISGSNNTAIGQNTLSGLTSGSSNVAIGQGAMFASTSPSQNVAIGRLAGENISTGNNVIIGFEAVTNSSGGGNTVALGTLCLTNVTGSGNVAAGYSAGTSLTSGTNNILLGINSGTAYTSSESGNIVIGPNGVVSESNITRIGYINGTASTQAACYVDGISGVSVTGTAVLVATTGQLGVAASSERFKENINDMGSESDALMSLRPVTFNYKQDATKSKSFGLIAEEVNELIPELVQLDKEGNPFTVKYNELPALLLNEIQKLNKRIAELEQRLN